MGMKACKIHPKIKKKKKWKTAVEKPTVSVLWLVSNCLSALFPLLFCNSLFPYYSYKKTKTFLPQVEHLEEMNRSVFNQT